MLKYLLDTNIVIYTMKNRPQQVKRRIIRGRRLAVEHVLGMMAAGDSTETILEGYPWLEREDIPACLAHAHGMVGHERVEPILRKTGT